MLGLLVYLWNLQVFSVEQVAIDIFRLFFNECCFMTIICSLLSIHSWLCPDRSVDQNNEFDMYMIHHTTMYL
jgi:hypothetical protein